MAPPDQMMLQPSVHSALRATRPRLQSALDAIGEELRNLEEQRRALLEEEEGLRTLLGLGEASPNGKILRGRVALEVVVSILQEIGGRGGASGRTLEHFPRSWIRVPLEGGLHGSAEKLLEGRE